MTTGILYKMRTSAGDNSIVNYEFHVSEFFIPLHEKIGQKISLKFSGKIKCVACGRDIKKTFQQGYCFPCTQKLAETDLCIVKPEICHHHLGTCRDNDFAQKHCFIPHVVYLAVSSGVKVGITRAHQKWTRWADQGAGFAIEFALTSSRRDAGFVEVEIAKKIPDKTNWRKLLQGDTDEIDLLKLKNEFRASLTLKNASFEISSDDTIHYLKYPVLAYPQKITSLDLEKTPNIVDELIGIKGQYLIFKNGVLNVRKFQGFELKIN